MRRPLKRLGYALWLMVAAPFGVRHPNDAFAFGFLGPLAIIWRAIEGRPWHRMQQPRFGETVTYVRGKWGATTVAKVYPIEGE